MKVGEEVTTDTGLKYTVTAAGKGAKPAPGNMIKAHYTGTEIAAAHSDQSTPLFAIVLRRSWSRDFAVSNTLRCVFVGIHLPENAMQVPLFRMYRRKAWAATRPRC